MRVRLRGSFDMTPRAHEDLDGRLLHRLLFFTDAVFAIVMTLLVLELRPPEGDSAAQFAVLRGMGGKFFAFALSFAILGIFWLAHAANTRRLAQFDWPTAAVNFLFLFPVCLIPFVSAWVGGAVSSATAWIAYCVVLIATSAASVALILVESRDGGRLMAGGMGERERMYRVGRAACPGLAFVVGLASAAAGQLLLAQLCWLLIPVFRVAVGRLAPSRA
jgi:uncharacterized membrane protein